MITVHHLEHSRSQRILWLLEELSLDYEVKRYARDPKTFLAPPELFSIHPLGKSPVITDSELPKNEQTIAETGAIFEYLVAKAGGQLKPIETTALRQWTYWLHFAEGSMMPNLVMQLIFQKVRTAPMPFFAKPIAKAIADNVGKSFLEPNVKRQLDFIEGHLTRFPWFAGSEFSAADIMMSFPLEAAKDSKSLPSIAKFQEKIKARPSYQHALDRGGPFKLATR